MLPCGDASSFARERPASCVLAVGVLQCNGQDPFAVEPLDDISPG
jgi:hypothetical protein